MPKPRKVVAPANPFVKNMHPADELYMVRAEMKALVQQEEGLRARLMAMQSDGELAGDSHTAVLVPATRETLDRKAITEAFGEAAVAPFIKTTAFTIVKLVENG